MKMNYEYFGHVYPPNDNMTQNNISDAFLEIIYNKPFKPVKNIHYYSCRTLVLCRYN